MDGSRLIRFQTLLEQELRELSALSEVRREAAGTVTLDQAASGRVTRVDAMQQQAMAQAEMARAGHRQRAITAALGRIREGVYGDCPDCGREIDERRLAAEPTALLCIGCASAREGH